MDDLTGKLLGDRYRVEGFFGHGGMADVYQVWDLQRAVYLALKILHSDLAEDAVFLRRFKREAQVLEHLQHPNIVRFYGLEEWGGLAYILMDFIDGLTLRKEIFLNNKGLRPARILQLVQPVCSALHYAHRMGMVHCDIKPANIMIHRNGTVYLTDFGIARVIEGRTQSFPSAGTPAYMAPELIMGQQPTAASDIYSLGVVIYEMLTGGERPFTGEAAQRHGNTTQRIVWEKNNIDPPPPSRYNRSITPELEAVTLHCLEREPSARFASVLDLSNLLEQAVHGFGDNIEIQTLMDIYKTAEPILRPEWSGSWPLPGQNDSADENVAPGQQFESPPAPNSAEPEPLEGDHSMAPGGITEAASAPGQPVSNDPPQMERALVLTSSSPLEPTSLPALRAFPNRNWLTVGAAAVVILFILWAATSSLGMLRQASRPPSHAAAAAIPTIAFTQPAAAGPQETSTGSAFPGSPSATPTSILAAVQRSPMASTPTITPQPTVTPPGGGGGKIAFASDRGGSVQIWIMDSADPTNRQQVTNINGGACQPAWSPNGTQIAFVTPCNGPRLTYPGAKIKIIQLQSGEIRDLKLQGGAFEPDWSPDGETIAYTTFRGSQTAIQAVDLASLQTQLLSQRGSKNCAADWSPDGRRVAFISDFQGVDEIWMMQGDGTSQEMLTQAGELKYFSKPDWSMDGKHILAGMKEINQPAPVEVLVVIDHANPRPGGESLLPTPMRMEDGAFSPDGDLVAFWTVLEGDNMEIMLAGPGETVTRLTNHEARDFHPAWSPNADQGQ